MPRPLRIHLAGGFYHVTLRGNHQQDVFVAEQDRHLLNKIVARALERFGARLHAYCWMTNHLHFLLQAGNDPIGNPMRQIASEFARAMQSKLETTGHYFERRYHATLVDVDSYLLELLRYIHLNPVRAGLVRGAAQFPWSSHHAYTGARREAWVTTDFALQLFSADRSRAVTAYRRFVDSPPDEALCARIEEGQDLLGDDEFTASVSREALPGRRRQTLVELIDEACRRFEFGPDRLQSPARDPYAMRVRAWIAHQARVRGIAVGAVVARALGRTEATLRHAIKTHPEDLD
jgi:REP element-mobilizing transposase RayT